MVFTLLEPEATHTVDASVVDGRVVLAAGEVQRSLGWALKPEGVCRGDVCIPVRDTAALQTPDGISLVALADVLGRPLAVDIDARAAFLGIGASERGRRLASLDAPDFTLPDLDGRLHTLREHRGKKVFLVVWASW